MSRMVRQVKKTKMTNQMKIGKMFYSFKLDILFIEIFGFKTYCLYV